MAESGPEPESLDSSEALKQLWAPWWHSAFLLMHGMHYSHDRWQPGQLQRAEETVWSGLLDLSNSLQRKMTSDSSNGWPGMKGLLLHIQDMKVPHAALHLKTLGNRRLNLLNLSSPQDMHAIVLCSPMVKLFFLADSRFCLIFLFCFILFFLFHEIIEKGEKKPRARNLLITNHLVCSPQAVRKCLT